MVKQHHNGSLEQALHAERYVFLSYVASFVIVGELSDPIVNPLQ